MKKYISGLLVLIAGFAFSQTILNAASPEEFRKLQKDDMRIVGDSMVSNKITPLKYGYVDEKDIRKSVYVWEIVDLNDKINQPFYYNLKDGFSGQTKSLYQILFDGAMSGKIAEVYDDENFTRRLTPVEIEKRLTTTRVSDVLIDIINSSKTPTAEEIKAGTDVYVTDSRNVKLLKIMGMWYIDIRDGQMKYRPLGIAAMGPDPATAGQFGPDGLPIAGANDLIDLFWVFYPDARELLANSAVYNKGNASSNINFDDLLNARRFSSIIYKSSAGNGDGKVADYIPKNAADQIEESNRIKAEILTMENEMWNY